MNITRLLAFVGSPLIRQLPIDSCPSNQPCYFRGQAPFQNDRFPVVKVHLPSYDRLHVNVQIS